MIGFVERCVAGRRMPITGRVSSKRIAVYGSPSTEYALPEENLTLWNRFQLQVQNVDRVPRVDKPRGIRGGIRAGPPFMLRYINNT
jgi:hypothetical protein